MVSLAAKIIPCIIRLDTSKFVLAHHTILLSTGLIHFLMQQNHPCISNNRPYISSNHPCISSNSLKLNSTIMEPHHSIQTKAIILVVPIFLLYRTFMIPLGKIMIPQVAPYIVIYNDFCSKFFYVMTVLLEYFSMSRILTG